MSHDTWWSLKYTQISWKNKEDLLFYKNSQNRIKVILSTTNRFCLVGIGANTAWIFSKGRYGLFIIKSDFGLQSYYKFVFSYLLYKMNRIFVPIFFIYPILLSIEIQLIHSECYQNVFGLPQFFIRVPVRHTYGLHHISTSRIVYIMCSCWYKECLPVSTCRPLPGTASVQIPLYQNFFPISITQIVAVVFAYMDTADRYIVFFQTNGIVISCIFLYVSKIFFCFLYIPQWKHRKKCIYVFITKNGK